MTITIIGLGLIGGSVGLELKTKRFADRIVGVDKDPGHCRIALERGLVDEVHKLVYAVQQSDLIILAVPVDSILTMLPFILDYVTHQVVTDMGSTKMSITERVKDHPKRSNYVPSHPMAGTEFSGPEAAIPGLFNKKVGIICDMSKSHQKALETVTNLYMALNMRLVFMNSREHDLHTAYVSHISHITSFALALTVLDKEQNEKNIMNLASGGFDSTVRLAASSAEMWVPVFDQNREHVVEVIDTYVEKILKFKEYIASGDNKKVNDLIKKANKIQKTLSSSPWKQQ
jgi:prephenate dehydrogenase